MKKKIFLTFLSLSFFALVNASTATAKELPTYIQSVGTLDEHSANNIKYYDLDDCDGKCMADCKSSDGSDITVIGDSILTDGTTRTKLKEKFSGLTDDSFNTRVARPWNEGVEEAKNTTLKNIVIFELGTNNNPGITAEQINEIVQIIGSNKTLILVTPYSATNAQLQSAYDQTAIQFKKAAENNSQIKVADWAAAAKNAGLTLNDGENHVHPVTDEERQLYVDTISSVVGGSCSSGEAVVSGDTAEEKVWSGLISLGFTPEQTAGIMGNIAHEGIFNPVQWQVGDKFYPDWGTSFKDMCARGPGNDLGVGMIGFTWYTYYCIFDEYYAENAPDLVKYYTEADTYSRADNGSRFCGGTDCLLKKMSDNEANRLYSTQLTVIGRVVNGYYADKYGFKRQDHFLTCTTARECAYFWEQDIEKHASGVQQSRYDDAEKFFNEFSGQTSFGPGSTGGKAGTNCNNTKTSTAFKTYDFTDGQLRGMIAMAKKENGGSLRAMQSELSIMANLFEKNGGSRPKTAEGMIDYIKTGGWFTETTGEAYSESFAASDEELAAAKDILVEGNRTLPLQVVHHDCFSDITKASNDNWKTTFDASDRSQYKKNVTKIRNKYMDSDDEAFIFYDWADPDTQSGDPFGYNENDKPDEFFVEGDNNSNISEVKVKWSNGWITEGMPGYVKGTPEMAGLTVTDSAVTMPFITNSPKTGKVGANKILLHNTEGYNNTGEFGLDIYRGNPYPSHFTIDLKEKKVFQHFSIDGPAAGVVSYDTSAGVQIEIIGFSTEKDKDNSWYLFNSEEFGDEEWKYLATLLVAISDYTGVELKSSVDWTSRDDAHRLSPEDFKNYTGVLGHQHVPSNSHIDPGNVWPMLEKQIKNLKVSNESGACGEVKEAADFEWYAQCDERWGSSPFDPSCGNICTCGCGTTSYTMMAQALTRTKLNPADVAAEAYSRGGTYYDGSRWAMPVLMEEVYGISAEPRDFTVDEISAELRKGSMLWLCGSGSNPFSGGGHCIGVRGITADGKWLLADSAGSRGKTNSLETEWDPSVLMNGRHDSFNMLRYE